MVEEFKGVRQHQSMLHQPTVAGMAIGKGFAGFKHSTNCLPNPFRSSIQEYELGQNLEDGTSSGVNQQSALSESNSAKHTNAAKMDAVRKASQIMDELRPLKPERLHNKMVSKPGFGGYLAGTRAPSQTQLDAARAKQTAIAVKVTASRRKLLSLQKDAMHSAWRDESKGHTFCHAYNDEEGDHEEQKKVARTRDSMPFGMNIRSAAHKAAFGTAKGPLLRYATMGGGTGRKMSDVDHLDDLVSEEDSDSVSHSSSEDLDLDDLEVLEAGAKKKPPPKESAMSLTEKKFMSGPIAPIKPRESQNILSSMQ